MTDVVADRVRERRESLGVKQLESIDQQIVVLTRGNARAPALPSSGRATAIDRGAEQA
jgi:hypothetical protein